MGVNLAPQIGFAKSKEGPYKRYRLGQLPTRDEFLEQGHSPEYLQCIQVWGADLHAARELLERKGYKLGSETTNLDPPSGRHATKTEATYGDNHFRALLKMALNYLVATQGSKFAEHPAFERALRYIVNGDMPPWLPIRVRKNQWEVVGPDKKIVSGHYVALVNTKNYVAVYISLFMRQLWCARIAQEKDFPILPGWEIAHIFDIGSRQTSRIPVPVELKVLPEDNEQLIDPVEGDGRPTD
jgi:hypothetical protein